MERRPEPRFDWFIPIDGDGAQLWNGISKVRVNLGTAIVGDPEQVTAELAAYWRLGIDERAAGRRGAGAPPAEARR